MLRKFWTAYKNYNYKWATAAAIMVIVSIIKTITNWEWLGNIIWVTAIYLMGYLFIGMYHAAKNTWNDGGLGNKIWAVVYSILVLGALGAVAYSFLI